jgi:hypothetical protein
VLELIADLNVFTRDARQPYQNPQVACVAVRGDHVSYNPYRSSKVASFIHKADNTPIHETDIALLSICENRAFIAIHAKEGR